MLVLGFNLAGPSLPLPDFLRSFPNCLAAAGINPGSPPSLLAIMRRPDMKS